MSGHVLGGSRVRVPWHRHERPRTLQTYITYGHVAEKRQVDAPRHSILVPLDGGFFYVKRACNWATTVTVACWTLLANTHASHEFSDPLRSSHERIVRSRIFDQLRLCSLFIMLHDRRNGER